MYYLAGDIGGTKALLQLVQIESDSASNHVAQPIVLAQQRYLCSAFDSLESIVSTFLRSLEFPNCSNIVIDAACFGLPGPVDGRTVQLTNLPWEVNANLIEQVCAICKVSLVNDFYVAALGVEQLMPDEQVTLYDPPKKQSVKGNRLVIGAGTGLGVAPVFFDGQHFLPQASEGGHFDFAPISDTQQCLLGWLWQRWEHVSYERVLSGPGLETLYEFFCLHELPNTYSQIASQKLHKNKVFNSLDKNVNLVLAGCKKEPPFQPLTAPQIQHAAEKKEPTAVKAVMEFVTIYGAFVGAAALIWNAPGGIYLAGGVATKLQAWMQEDVFLKAFLEKGRMTKVVQTMPIYLVTDEALGLKGALLAAKNDMA
ncbi:MAG: glucokinase [Thiomicrorhabdus sp.]|nr:glucokinase [Thiomicrorhabdus sp.]